MQHHVSRRALGITGMIVAAVMTIVLVATASGRAPAGTPGSGGGEPRLLSEVGVRLA